MADRTMVAAGAAVGCAVRAGVDGRGDPDAATAGGHGDAAREIALAVAKAAVEDGVAPGATEAELRAAVSVTQWTPQYA
ncbi:hypothetical protein OG604_02520 [Streptomyces sp. NBC_01231]|nr:hypothetical protein OG604_02520 [Streptomyces sp. NBC_01231]